MISKFKQEAKDLISFHTWIGLVLFVVFAQFVYGGAVWIYERLLPMVPQYWPENGDDTELKIAGTKTLPTDMAPEDIPSWPYLVEAIDETATECYLQWLTIGYTMTGRKIPYTERTEWFDVNVDI